MRTGSDINGGESSDHVLSKDINNETNVPLEYT
jgi:hypothetical protein